MVNWDCENEYVYGQPDYVPFLPRCMSGLWLWATVNLAMAVLTFFQPTSPSRLIKQTKKGQPPRQPLNNARQQRPLQQQLVQSTTTPAFTVCGALWLVKCVAHDAAAGNSKPASRYLELVYAARGTQQGFHVILCSTRPTSPTTPVPSATTWITCMMVAGLQPLID